MCVCGEMMGDEAGKVDMGHIPMGLRYTWLGAGLYVLNFQERDGLIW